MGSVTFCDKGRVSVLHCQVEEPALDCEDPVDCRQWTQHHLVAADIRMPPSMALTPPQGEFDTDCMDVNVRGPGNMLDGYCTMPSGGVFIDNI